MRDSTQIYPLSSERAELSLINQCGCLPLPRPWPLCPFAHLTVAYCSDKKTRLSTRLLLIKTERGFGSSLYLKHTIETIFAYMHCTREELQLNGVLSPHRRLLGSSCLEGASHPLSQSLNRGFSKLASLEKTLV